MNTELYHWKYIKREKVGGKWKYIYDTGADAKKRYDQAKKNLDTRNAQERSAWRHNLPSGGTNNVAFNNWTHYRYSDKGVRDKLEKSYKEAKSEYSKSPIAKKEQRAENTKRNIEKVKNWAKDVAGYDEKQAMESANTKALIKSREAADEYVDNSIWKGQKSGDSRIAELADWQINYKNELAKEARDEADKAAKEFAKTPLGMLERAKDFVDSSEEHHEYSAAAGARDRTLQRYEATLKEYNEVKGKVDSGEYFDKDRGNYSIIEPYEKEYRKALQEYVSANERYEKTKKEYEATPQYKLKKASDRINSGRDTISDLLGDRKKDWSEAKKRGTDKAVAEATKYDGGIAIGPEGSKKIGKTTFTDTNRLFSGTTTINTLDSQVSEVRRGKVDRFIDTMEEYGKLRREESKKNHKK